MIFKPRVVHLQYPVNHPHALMMVIVVWLAPTTRRVTSVSVVKCFLENSAKRLKR